MKAVKTLIYEKDILTVLVDEKEQLLTSPDYFSKPNNLNPCSLPGKIINQTFRSTYTTFFAPWPIVPC